MPNSPLDTCRLSRKLLLALVLGVSPWLASSCTFESRPLAQVGSSTITVGDFLTAARAAGGWLLGSRSAQLDPYLAALRAALDPRGIMNPGALT